MQIARFVNPDGDVGWGRLESPRHAVPLAGRLFDEPSFGGPAVEVRRLVVPVDPPNILAIGRNYREHAEEMKADEALAEPLVFLKATTSVIGPDEPIVLPLSAPNEVDYEAELAVIIGRQAKNVGEAAALDHVFGYTCANDVTARDCQKRRDKQWARAKSFDTFCPLGPTIVTADELRPDALLIRSILNGRVMQEADTSALICSVPKLISYLAHQFTLLPGTVILTGTPAGVGAARTPPVFLRPGDEIAVEIEGIGRLSNRVTG